MQTLFISRQWRNEEAVGWGSGGRYKDGQAVNGDERRPGHLPSDVGGESLTGKKATGNGLRVTGRRRWRQVMGFLSDLKKKIKSGKKKPEIISA